MTGRMIVASLAAGWRSACALGAALQRPTMSTDAGDVRGFLLHSQLNMSFLPRPIGPGEATRHDGRTRS